MDLCFTWAVGGGWAGWVVEGEWRWVVDGVGESLGVKGGSSSFSVGS